MIQYLISATAIWLMSLVLFDVFLRKENYHNYNRFYLLFTFLLGALLPLWQSGNGITGFKNAALTVNPDCQRWFTIVYFAGAAIAASLLAIDIIKLIAYYYTGIKSKQDGVTVIETGKAHPPFSCLDVLFISERTLYNDEEWQMILAHERQHSVLLHFIDVLLMQLARIPFWFHPLVHVYNNRLLLVHEYQADRASSQNPQEYGRFLVEQTMLQPTPSLAHSLNHSPIKSRIVMLTRNLCLPTGTANLKSLLVVPLTFFCLFLFTKNSYSINPGPRIWKKQVARVIDMAEKNDSAVHHLRDYSSDKTLFEIVVNSIRSNKLPAYSNSDHYFTAKLSVAALNTLVSPIVDTVIQTDPKTGKVISKMTRAEFDYGKVHKYRILEEWSFNPSNGKTEIAILGMAPIEEIYGDDGSFRGVRAMFWLRYNDVQRLLADYDLYHPNNTISSLIWNDYFSTDEGKLVRM